ncbi:B-cell receptor CD22-like isoform X1 [Sinocyclocheilus anshuiensis]|uniref:B-cell receptor CD22-like isoform X1 n=1 Tax=Sinocyclocheilus anshuiensis TaxID=1608454 RepID=UPI0007B78D14|nr:PREDICTED: B-cell receptor CD22-like isoform X1 [Sinocyclocheilus anshuiensis]
MSCTYTYPTGHQITKGFWTKQLVKYEDTSEVDDEDKDSKFPDLSKDPKYSQRLQYLVDKQQNCTIRLSHVTQKDEHMYYFRFITDKDKWLGVPGVSLTVTDLQVESPERVTEGDSVRLTCKSSCALTDRATFIWYRNSQPLTERRDRNNQLLLQSVRREDAGRYSCALHGHTYISPAVYLNVTYPPKSVSVSISPSGEIVEGDSVTLNCSSNSNPPVENSWFKGGMFVGSGRIYSISNISSDHSEEYKCKSRNKHGERYSDAVTLNIMYSPKNVSVSISPSGEKEDSVTLICSSDSNPPAENIWFNENQSSAVGSGQSFSALQSGRFYCEAYNQHGSQRSDAVTVTVKGGDKTVLYAAVAIAAGCGLLFLICIIMFIRKTKSGVADVRQKQVQQPSSSERNHCDDGLYARVSPKRPSADQTAGKAKKIVYATFQHIRNNESNENLRVHHPDPAARFDAMVGKSVIYSRIK